ncbi:MAG: hypothetical protein JRM98_01350 [Nitrososphaerota archaeon]|jgi:hypothetical protein|nr:hypothetical protein [Nitrososphaerota archaeon]
MLKLSTTRIKTFIDMKADYHIQKILTPNSSGTVMKLNQNKEGLIVVDNVRGG